MVLYAITLVMECKLLSGSHGVNTLFQGDIEEGNRLAGVAGALGRLV